MAFAGSPGVGKGAFTGIEREHPELQKVKGGHTDQQPHDCCPVMVPIQAGAHGFDPTGADPAVREEGPL
jgi:hypothetical protein